VIAAVVPEDVAARDVPPLFMEYLGSCVLRAGTKPPSSFFKASEHVSEDAPFLFMEYL
jgi:hypothetical protein